MKFTQKRTEVFLRFYYELLQHADRWCETFPGRHGTVRITEWGTIEEEINTACHCHPEYEWVTRGNVEQLVDWINQQNS